ncbi:unnamed protein product [Rotaria magnacalcarata]|uniref:Uncharacterized protein n=4 Tax=Rotaria magnacalcarata TaxID=392030 RepID=A0A816YV76_9BILA|nr:unnamed protein product [Rotaria magnacalcarata]CAF1428365.1 unnamed protein product [Rotaria magnacalcarata]CAF2139346.1 unnamed protein product [Rotaria magnacalcarata]CAF2170057.1 unnamed protein product [Rotaria magnacalcarata]CAF3720311.1 unnamed protein product [Rotaria magnacalcarata]
MTLIKVIIGLILINVIFVCDGQHITPEQLRKQNEISNGARSHYDITSGRRTDMFNRVNPDYLLRGFFPFWSIVLIGFALMFLTLAMVGVIGYLLGCRRPTLEELYGNDFEQITPDEEFLLGTGPILNMNDTKISTQNSTTGLFNNHHQRDFQYESLLLIERTRIGQSHEDVV